ncbi:hypothetical protein ACRQ4B_06150 [Curtobacterium sp. SP.BCo]|uniref:hypothetical protein n=1 Tax=Curtobacterium sp. SP.BCo TaxID=3435229 RepID=UPI003F73DD19
MDMGRVILGACTAGAVVLAIGLGVVTAPSGGLTTDVRGGGICGTFPDGSTSASTWFMTSFRNDTGHGVRVRDVRPAELHRVTLSHLSIAAHPATSSPGLVVTDDADRPAEYGRTVAVDSGYVVPAHGELDVVGRLVLRDGADAGRLHGVVVTTVGTLGALQSVTDPGSFGIGIGEGHDESDIGCVGA